MLYICKFIYIYIYTNLDCLWNMRQMIVGEKDGQHICIYIYMYIYTYIYIYIFISSQRMCVCVYIYMNTNVNICNPWIYS